MRLSLPRRAATALTASSLALALTLAVAPVAADDTDPAPPDGVGLPPVPAVAGLPIVSLPTDLLVPQFLGAPARERPIKHPRIAQAPTLAENGRSSMHNDAYSSDAYQVSGPLGRDLQVTSASYGIRECATMTFDRRGRIQALCGGLEGFVMMLIDPDTLEPLAQLETSRRDLSSGANPFTDICGGTYFYLDHRDRALVTTNTGELWEIVQTPGPGLKRTRSWDVLAGLPEDDCVVAVTPDWKGRDWFFTQGGYAGTLDRKTGKVRTVRLKRPKGPVEGIFNSVSADETGAVYAVSTHATYRLDAGRRGKPRITWRLRYDRGSEQKPGMLSQGSGTTPTLIGKRWLVIADNADPRTQILAIDRRPGVPRKRRLHCRVPVLPSGASTTENSLVAAGRSVMIENNYGYTGPASTIGRSTTPGFERVLIRPRGKCRVAWRSKEIAPTSVPKASVGNGLVYAYTKPEGAETFDAWYLTAIDIRTGNTAWSQLTGTGSQWNNHYAAIYLGPDGAAYIATMTGLIRFQDGDR
ncbi:MAG: hypothetical protein Q8Q02_08225 [Nocardioides sp.]|nr:hypothetical protein [Nocardioides sp.]